MTDSTTDSEPAAHKEDKQDYVVLARKYRPSHFDELIGQDALVRTLKNAIETGRIAHAYMLTGVRGVGKTTTARIIAKALNYQGPDGQAGPTIGPTDDCETCQAITKDRHPDVMEMDAASRTGVDDIREILDGVRYAPVSARYKVYIIDEVHMLSKQAFNALLKTLEEPPPHVIFIFATTEIRKVPVTVLSRCQRFDLKRVDVSTLKDFYGAICDKEGVKVHEGALTLIAQAADGSVRDGLSLLDQAIAQRSEGTEQEVSLEAIQDMLGLADRGKTLALLEASLTANPAQALDIVADLFKNGADPQMVLQDMIDLVHGLSRAKVTSGGKGNGAGGLQLGPDLENKAGELAENFSMPSLGRAWDILLTGMKDIAYAPNPEKSAEMTIIRLAYAANLPDPAKILKDLENGTIEAGDMPAGVQNDVSRGEGAPVSAEARQYVSSGNGGQTAALRVVANPEENPKTDEDLTTLPGIVKALENSGHIRLAMDVRQFVQLVGIQGQKLDFNPIPGTPKTFANELQTKLGEISGSRWFVSISSKPGELPMIEQEREAQAHYLEGVKAHPLVKSVLEAFPGAQIETVYPINQSEKEKD